MAREVNNMLLRRLIFAWRWRTWPWTIPRNVVKYVALDQRFTQAEIDHAHELARKHGWK